MGNLKWSVIEYEERDRSKDWYWALGIIVVAGSITSIIFANYFFAVFLFLAGGSIAMLALKKPEMVDYEIGAEGLRIKNQIYLYKHVKSFFVRDDERPLLFIKSDRVFMPIVQIPLGDQNPEQVREIMLSSNIKEEEMKEHFGEKVMDHLGF